MAVPATRLKSAEVVLHNGITRCTNEHLSKALADCERLHEIAVADVKAIYAQATKDYEKLWGVSFDPQRHHATYPYEKGTARYKVAVSVASRCMRIFKTLKKLKV